MNRPWKTDIWRPLIIRFKGRSPSPAYPVHFSACNAGTWRAAPRLGEHTDEVLQQMGFSNTDIEKLRSDGIIK